MLIEKVLSLRSNLGVHGGSPGDIGSASQTVEDLLGRLRALQAGLTARS